MKRNAYVVAVSGGVDSMVLLDALLRNSLSELTDSPLTTNYSSLIIAHFDHGIREDSQEDERFVRGVAEKYGVPYESARAELGSDASEDQARIARYNFLRRCCKKYNAELVAAHHQNDVIESMLINLIRGTGWRGLAPMTPAAQIPNPKSQIPTNNQKSIINNQTIRPLINVPKAEILAYAKKYDIKWHEDSTNADTKYLRNYIRHTLLPQMAAKDPEVLQKLITINKQVVELRNKIATELQNLTIHYSLSTTHYNVPRHNLIMAPPLAAQELIYYIVTQLDPSWHPSMVQVKRALHFIKTKRPGKQIELGGLVYISLTKREVLFIKQQNRGTVVDVLKGETSGFKEAK